MYVANLRSSSWPSLATSTCVGHHARGNDLTDGIRPGNLTDFLVSANASAVTAVTTDLVRKARALAQAAAGLDSQQRRRGAF